MGKIKKLKEEVFKKIAAGEVVERPISVIKELVENSIDAGADTIEIKILEGGKKLIKVFDNGEGFESDDIKIAFLRHSTSKLTELSDFNNLKTLGFRGEALPSILEVSKIELKTSTNNEGSGIHCFFENGQLIAKHDIAFNRGTSIEIRELFYNFPVRKKFLKSDRAELIQINSYLEQIALVNFNISFKLFSSNKKVFIYNKVGNLKERIYQIFGKDFLDSIKEVNFENELYKLHGFISRINTGVSIKKYRFFFVNKRPVREKTLISSFNNTFKKFLEKHKNPIGILILDIPPDEIDVNIHPMKLEVRFKNSNSIYQFLKQAIENSFFGDKKFEADMSFSRIESEFNNQTSSEIKTNESHFDQSQLLSMNHLVEDDFTLIGQYKNSYLIVEKDNQLLIIDQHNAHERVIFDKLKEQYNTGRINSISPLFPIIIELASSDVSNLEMNKTELIKSLGFELHPLSGNSYDIKQFPQILEEQNIRDIILSIIHLKREEINFEDRVIAEIACKSAIKINHNLYPEQIKAIVRDLFKTSNPYFCPHKRPIIKSFVLEEIEKMLKRK